MNKLYRALLLAGSLLATSAQAAFSGLYVFGDSLSDPGNLVATSEAPPAPYVGGRFSNGPVAAEYLGTKLGLTAAQVHNYAVGGATTGYDNPESATQPHSGVLSQLGQYMMDSGGGADANAVYMIWAGANDLLAISSPADVPTVLGNAITNLITEVVTLHMMGAQHIFVPNMVDLGLTPEARSQGPAVMAQYTYIASLFNLALANNLPSYATQFDTFGLLQDVVSAPTAYGLSNATDQCLTSSVCSQPGQYLFWDHLHPTTAGHLILADQFAAAIPEPQILALVLVALLGLGYRQTTQRRI